MKHFLVSVLIISPCYVGAMSESINETAPVESRQKEDEPAVKRARSEDEQYEAMPVKRALESESISHAVKRVAFDFSELEKLSVEQKNLRLLEAAASGDANLVEALVLCGADKDASTEEWLRSLHLAAKNGHVEAIVKLHELGADIYARDKYSRAPLHLAASNGHVGVIEKLYELGAAIYTKDRNGFTPLHHAARDGQVEVIAKLGELGADIDVRDTNGRTPCMFAAVYGQVEVIVKLREFRADIDVRDNNGRTALYHAAEHGQVEVIAKLSELGATIDMQTSAGSTLLHVAASKGHVEVIEKLGELGATIDAQAVHIAAENGRVKAIAKLRELGATVDVPNEKGFTPLQVAARNGGVAAVRELLSPLPYGNDKITLTFVGGEKREVSKNVVLISTTLRSVCDSSNEDMIPLTTISAVTWDTIMRFEKELYALEFIYGQIGLNDEDLGSEYGRAKHSLVQAYQTLSYEEIHKILDAANFLEIKVLVRWSAAALIEKTMKKCSHETRKFVAREFKNYSKKNF